MIKLKPLMNINDSNFQKKIMKVFEIGNNLIDFLCFQSLSCLISQINIEQLKYLIYLCCNNFDLNFYFKQKFPSFNIYLNQIKSEKRR